MQDTILYNAKIYTMNDTQPIASAMMIHDGRILALGSDEDILSAFGLHALKQDLHGKILLPGLQDAHLHLQFYALGLQKVDCETTTKKECLRRVAERVQGTPNGEWILGHGWNQNVWQDLEGDGFPSCADLDVIAPDHPVYLTDKSLHAGWLNSTAMRLLGVTTNTTDPKNGRFLRDQHGKPTGIVLELAMEWVLTQLPEPTSDRLVRLLNDAQHNLIKMGLTSVSDFDQSSCFSALQQLHRQGELKLRVTKSIAHENLEHAIAMGLQTGFGDDRLHIGSVKLFADGALGPHTAAMLEAYNDDPTNLGSLFMDGETMFEIGRKAVEHGISIAVHAIGDRANHEVLNAIENLRRFETLNGLPHLRHRIEHAQILHPQDADRLAKLNVIASMQPIHALSDMVTADRCWGKRADLSYAWRTQLQHSAVLAFGSDAPVESPNPFWGLFAAVTRSRFDGYPEKGWYPEQRLTMQEALYAYTQGVAYACGMEEKIGKLAPDYLADLIVLRRDEDPFTAPVEMLQTMQPERVMISGEWVFENN